MTAANDYPVRQVFPPVGGRLSLFKEAWGRVTSDKWVLDTISAGYQLEFTCPPPSTRVFRRTSLPKDPVKKQALLSEVRILLQKGAIERVSPKEISFMSTFFLTTKKSGEWRPILNLKPLNAFIKPKNFRMETLAAVLRELHAGWWGATLDLKDAYLHVPVKLSDRKWLGFCIGGQTYRYRVLPFGLSTAPRTFTRVVKVVAEYLRQRGIFVYVYLDDWLITAPSPGILSRQIQTVSQLVTSLGLIINTEKSALVPVPGSQASLRRRKGGPNRGESDSDHRMCRRTVVSRDCSSQTVDAAPRPHGEPDSHPTPVQTPHESHPAPRALQVQTSQEPAVHSDPQLPEDKEGAPMVDSATQPEARTAFFAPNTMFMPYYGCFQGGMGSALGGYYVIGQMDPGYRQAPHQQAGTPGYPSGSAETTPASQGSNSQGTLRQPISGDVHKPTGGNPQQIAVSPSSQTAHLVPAPRDTAPSGTSPRGGQQDSRCSVQGGNRPSDTEKGQRDLGGMAAEQSSVPDPIQSAGEAIHRPVCDEGKQPATSVLHVGPGPHGLRSGCHDHQLGQDAGLRISPHRSNTQGPGETLEIQELQDASSSSAMAQADVVPEAAVSHGSRADQPASDGGAHPTSGQDTDSTNDDSDPAPDCVDHFVRAYTADRLSEEAANLAAKARRPSTRATYNSRLKQYFSWCRGHQVSPHKAPVGAVAEFLTEQFKRKNAKPRSIRCFRTAIASIHHGFKGGLTVSSSPTLSSLIKGAFHERTPDRSLVPAWDLSLALGVVADSPYEPMHLLDLPELTRKTVFLVAAASGRRVSEIHALSTKEGHLRFSNGAVSLLPRAGFLAKNQTLDLTPKPIVLPDLRKASGSPDCGPWCPVRVLKYYLQKTEGLRLRPDGTTEDRLFLITVNPFTPAKKSTMARWIIQVIKESLSRQESQLAGSHVRAHDLRVQMASWALYKGASIQEVMDAAGWSSPTTFQSVYLRDPLCAQATTSARVLSAATSGSLRKQRD